MFKKLVSIVVVTLIIAGMLSGCMWNNDDDIEISTDVEEVTRVPDTTTITQTTTVKSPLLTRPHGGESGDGNATSQNIFDVLKDAADMFAGKYTIFGAEINEKGTDVCATSCVLIDKNIKELDENIIRDIDKEYRNFLERKVSLLNNNIYSYNIYEIKEVGFLDVPVFQVVGEVNGIPFLTMYQGTPVSTDETPVVSTTTTHPNDGDDESLWGTMQGILAGIDSGLLEEATNSFAGILVITRFETTDEDGVLPELSEILENNANK